jgi:uncharacterized membrane protein
MEYILYTFEFWTILSIIGLILIYFRRDVHIINEDWKTVKSKQNVVHLFFTMLLVLLILPFSIPYSLAHFRKK